MEGMSVAVLGGLLTATLGGILNRTFLKVKYNFSIFIWIMAFMMGWVLQFAFCVQFAFGSGITSGGNFLRWIIIALVSTIISVLLYFRFIDGVEVSRYEPRWRIGCGILLLLCGAGVIASSDWSVEVGWSALNEYIYVAVSLCGVTQLIVGSLVLFLDKSDAN